jgi:hypothetical protein
MSMHVNVENFFDTWPHATLSTRVSKLNPRVYEREKHHAECIEKLHENNVNYAIDC